MTSSRQRKGKTISNYPQHPTNHPGNDIFRHSYSCSSTMTNLTQINILGKEDNSLQQREKQQHRIKYSLFEAKSVHVQAFMSSGKHEATFLPGKKYLCIDVFASLITCLSFSLLQLTSVLVTWTPPRTLCPLSLAWCFFRLSSSSWPPTLSAAFEVIDPLDSPKSNFTLQIDIRFSAYILN